MSYDMRIKGNEVYDEYILVAPGSDYGRAMWIDVESLPNGTVLETAINKVPKMLTFLHHFHFSYTINKYFQLPFQQVWKKCYSLETVDWDDNKKYCVILPDNSACRIDRRYLMKLSERANITLVLVMVNTMARRGSLIIRRLPAFQLVFSFDKNDCERYGFIYHPTNYSEIQLSNNKKEVSDIFYVGVSKGRAHLISKIYQRMVWAGTKAVFYISGTEKNVKKVKGIYYNQWLDYTQVLDHISSTNCILEIMDGNQQGVTLRTMEAICYNKKLLTNNPLMRNSKYYKTGNIFVFDKVEDIDLNFVKNHDTVDYGYKGEFSPIHLLEHINKIQSGIII